MEQERCVILIDGSNFYYKLKDLRLNNLLAFDFSAFNQSLSAGASVQSATYYVGKVRTDGSDRSKRMQADQQRLFTHLTKHSYKYSLGYLLKYSDGVYHEKGVDVELALAIAVATYENTADKIILVSSDTDLIPAIKLAQGKGKIVEYVGFSHKPSVALVATCRQSRLLTQADVQAFLPPSN